jgi:hypothetical protein
MLKKAIIWTIIGLIDVSIYIILGLFLLDYDDFYDESKSAYWSFESMNSYQKKIYIVYNIWVVIHLLFALYLIIQFIRKVFFKKRDPSV